MKIEELKERLNILIESGSQIDITTARGRLINAYQKEIKKLSKNPYLTNEEKGKLEAYQLELDEEVIKHKIQISARYKNEFLEKKATPASTFVILPKAISLSAKKVAACVKDIKNGKNLKGKLKKTLEAGKAIGLFVATPAIYVGKFLVDQWYILAGAIGAAYLFDRYYGEKREAINNLFNSKIAKGFAKTLGLGDKFDAVADNMGAIDNAYTNVHEKIETVNNGISNVAEKIRSFSSDARERINDFSNDVGDTLGSLGISRGGA